MPFKLRATRLITASIVLFLLTWYFQVPERVWGLITIWFVMFEYTNVGGVLIKSYYRFAGTSLSAVYGLSIVYFFANDVIVNLLALIPAVLIYIYFFMDTEKAYIAIIGCVTLSIVLLNHNDIDAAILRTFNVILGILISMFMMRFFYPQYARDEILHLQSTFITQLSNIIRSYIDPSRSLLQVQEEAFQIEKMMLAKFATFNRRLRETKMETWQTPLLVSYHQEIFQHSRNILRLLSFLMHILATEENRLNSGVQNKCQRLLSMFANIEQRLNKQSLITYEFMPAMIEMDHQMTYKLLDNINKEAVLLDNATQHLMLQYTRYD